MKLIHFTWQLQFQATHNWPVFVLRLSEYQSNFSYFCDKLYGLVYAGDFLYPSDPDLCGARDVPSPLPYSLSELTDPSKSMNRITFDWAKNDQLNVIDTTIANSADVDSLLQKGTVTCNIH